MVHTGAWRASPVLACLPHPPSLLAQPWRGAFCVATVACSPCQGHPTLGGTPPCVCNAVSCAVIFLHVRVIHCAHPHAARDETLRTPTSLLCAPSMVYVCSYGRHGSGSCVSHLWLGELTTAWGGGNCAAPAPTGAARGRSPRPRLARRPHPAPFPMPSASHRGRRGRARPPPPPNQE